jgi:glycosyltransferase involved in cell wall biosynthesis
MASGTPALGLGVAGDRDALADGELGTETSEADLAATIAQLLEEPRPDSLKLAAAVHERFGRKKFAGAASTALNRLMELKQI